MKSLYVILVIIFSSFFSWSQVRDSIAITQHYVGILAISTIDGQNDFHNSQYVQFMAGVETKFKIFAGHSVVFRARYANPENYYSAFWYQRELEYFSLSVGYKSRQISGLIRPTPISFSSHFEPVAYTIIPGSALGLDVTYGNKVQGFYAGYGVSYDDKDKIPEMNVGLQYATNNFTFIVGALHSEKKDILACKGKVYNFSLMTCFTRDSLHSLHAGYSTPIVDPFFVGIYNFDTKKLSRYIVGATKTVDAPYGLKSLFGVGYEPITKEGRVYFMTWLD